MFCFQRFASHSCHWTSRTVFPQGGGVSNNLKLKVHVIKVNKGKIRPRSRDMYSKLDVGKIIIVGITFGLLMAKEIEKGISEGKEALIGIYLWK